MIKLRPSGPYDLALSLRVASSFSPERTDDEPVLRAGVTIGGIPARMEIRQTRVEPPVLQASTREAVDGHALREVAEWSVLADLDLKPFYAMCTDHQVLGPITRQLHGLKHLRPSTVFEMAIIAVTEQQISLAAAYRIRRRIIERFGQRVDGEWIFPGSEDLARSTVKELASCGLSGRKAEYIRDFAVNVAEGTLDIEGIRHITDDDARTLIARQRGFGRWSAEYILIRGLGRVDCVPADDLGIRNVLGHYLGDGSRMSAADVEEMLEPFRPYRGLTVFYLLAYSRFSGNRVSRTAE
jgi:DNA-3-methyladenine glycosylase II